MPYKLTYTEIILLYGTIARDFSKKRKVIILIFTGKNNIYTASFYFFIILMKKVIKKKLPTKKVISKKPVVQKAVKKPSKKGWLVVLAIANLLAFAAVIAINYLAVNLPI